MTIMIIATACTPIINIGHSSDGYAYHRRGASQRRSDEKERPRQDCRTRSRAPLRAALLRVRGFFHWAAGTLAYASVAVPSPCCAPGHGPTDSLRQGVRFWRWQRRGRRIQGPRFQSEFYLAQCAKAGRRGHGVLRLTPNALPPSGSGVRGQNRNLSLISVAERNQHRHSMTPGRLAAVKDRGCPPILARGASHLVGKNRLPPRPLIAAAARRRCRP